jgi:murein DD-endopeptidase MepM/ murein hydrolase activator NlpD
MVAICSPQYDTILVTHVGQKLERGQQIGTVGKGENNRYPAHLHFEIGKSRLPTNNWSPMVKNKDAVLANYHNPTDFVTIHQPGSLPRPDPGPSPEP